MKFSFTSLVNLQSMHFFGPDRWMQADVLSDVVLRSSLTKGYQIFNSVLVFLGVCNPGNLAPAGLKSLFW